MGELNIWCVAVVLYCGAILGDNSSYWLGRRYGMNLFYILAKWPVFRKFVSDDFEEKGREFFHKRGAAAVFFARLCGPFSWIAPAFAGAFRHRYPRFFLFNVFGVIVGIGEFLVVGYLFGYHVEEIAAWLRRLGIVPVLIVSFVLVWILRINYLRRLGKKDGEGQMTACN